MTAQADLPLVRIASSDLSATINPLGAELWSLDDGDGRALMTDADPAFWTGHAPILFPIVGTLRDDRYRLRDGRAFTLARHGFARRKRFAVVEREDSHAVFRLAADEETRAVYPFAFRLDVGFRIDGARLGVTATVANASDVPMPYSIGFHPAFAWPLPYGADKAAHRLTFAENEPEPVRVLNEDGLIAPGPRPSPVRERDVAPTAEMFADDALIWDRPASRTVRWGAPETPGLEVGFPDASYLGLWQKPGARYLCIEPWAGMSDPEGFDGVFEDKPGVRTLAPGEDAMFRMDVALTPAY